jgi:uncharacterized protein (DUF4415 family)
MDDWKPTKSQREAVNEMLGIMSRFAWDMARKATCEGCIPDEWRAIREGRSRRKPKLSFWIDEDVVRFFRSLGPGYGPRMNGVLRSFMLARMAGLIERDDLLREYRERWMGSAKPSVAGEVERSGGAGDSKPGVRSRRVVADCRHLRGGTRYVPGSARERHDHACRPSCDTAIAGFGPGASRAVFSDREDRSDLILLRSGGRVQGAMRFMSAGDP